ncbi:MFS transporter [Bradyrhizobium erythrophlei]|jgi:MFS family permease|uniref:Sugar phosphate permease n=1 Tax=Bradyrhizobium erythrophlei TaxID=1437360 RepID=A0A1M7UWE0_9BRAD|nr:MFS transporter [Bradyrhizobium erythrophlei]SHN87303.1 Sugar phosphate permease [Bradyrhizobium erythrophlei]
MDQKTPREGTAAASVKPVRTALGVLAICFALSVLGRGLGESFSVFLLPISENFGWDRADVVSVYSLSALAGGLASPLIGRLFDYSGPRSVYSLGLLLFGGAFLFAANADRLWQIQFSIGICVGLGIALIGNVPNSILLGRWFGPKLPTAMAVVYSATGAGVLALLPASQVLIDHFGWRGAYQIFGTSALVLLLPLLVLPWRLFSEGQPHLTKTATTDIADEGWTVGRAVRHHAFWALFWTFFFTAIGMYAITPQVVAYLIEAGFPPLQAATAWGFSGVVLLFGMLGVSWLDGIIGRRPSVLVSYALSIVGIFLLWLLQWYPNIWVLTGFVVCFGSMIGSRGPLLTATAMKLFKGKRVGTIYGSISIGSGLGSAFGSWSGGLIHDFSHSYNPLILYALIAVILGMIPFLVVPALRR